MEQQSEKQRTAEVVEQLQEEQIDLAVVRWIADEATPSAAQRRWLDQLRKERGDSFYGDLLFALTGRRYPPSEAQETWRAMTGHRDLLTGSLGRNPGIVVAALDWLVNIQGGKAMEFRLIESAKLDNMLERAVVDGLTGLYDHDTLLTLFEKEIERARRHSETISLLMLDFDDFKQVNDERGHQKGDEVLARLADIIRETIRTMDIAGRYGGEEFAILLPEADTAEAVRSAERLRQSVEDLFRPDVGLTVSVGVASFPDHAGTIGGLVKAADKALYAAKAQGKNRTVAGQMR
jgi:diguanylate cyclase (GGDEF)-like protein